MLDTPEPLRNLADLIAAQLEYHKRAYEILSELAPVVDGLQVEQEVRVQGLERVTLTNVYLGQLSEEPRRRLNVMQAGRAVPFDNIIPASLLFILWWHFLQGICFLWYWTQGRYKDDS